MLPVLATSKFLTLDELVVLLVLGVLAVLLVLAVFIWLPRGIARRPSTIRWAWRRVQPHGLSSRGRRLLPAYVCDCAALVLFRLANRPLRIRAFEAPEGIDGSTVSAALSAAMTRIASTHDSGVDTVTAPIEAETTVAAVAGAVKAVPAGGEFAAALVHLTAALLTPGEIQLSGQVLPANAGGPGLALTLSKARGKVRERLTLRADQLEPSVGADGDPGEEADRLTRLATAGAVWTHFQMLENEWLLSPDDLRRNLRTPSWRSYALMRIGIEGEERQGPDLARALYAEAVDADGGNITAQFNLASLELRDRELKQVRKAAVGRLQYVHTKLKQSGECKPPVSGWPARPKPELLLTLDPLCYQVSYKRIAAKLNHDVAHERTEEAASYGRLPDVPLCATWLDGAGSPCCRLPIARTNGAELDQSDFDDLTQHVRDLEWTLVLLSSGKHPDWRMAGRKPWNARIDVLSEIEGPMLALWAMVALRIGASGGTAWAPQDLWVEDLPPGSPGTVTREQLVESIERGALTPALAISCARGVDVLRRSRTRFTLACWYSDIGRLDEGLRELELSLEGGGEKARRRLVDPQLRHLEGREQEWETLLLRYATPPAAKAQVAGNGRRRGTLKFSLDL